MNNLLGVKINDMDTNRIKVYNHDLSTATIEAVTEYSGFTVVEAPKGPKTPIRLNANSAAKMQDIFGKSSADYPELFEAEVYNSQYDLYLSAPYTYAKVPAAYLTNKGFVLGADLVDYNDALEFFAINGYFENDLEEEIEESESGSEEDSEETENSGTAAPSVSSLKNIKEFADETFKILQPLDITFTYCQKTIDGYEQSIFIEIPTADTAEDENYDYSGIYRLTHLPYTVNDKDYLEIYLGDGGAIYGVQDDSSDENLIGHFVLFEKEEETLEGVTTYSLKLSDTDEYGRVASTKTISDDILETLPFEDGKLYFWLHGNEDSDLTPADIQYKLDEPAEQKNLQLYKKAKLTDFLGLEGDQTVKDAIYAVIIPKFPSKNTLHIKFQDFNLKNYKPNDPAARNILSITAWEDDAFHATETQGVTFTGSLDNQSSRVTGFNATNATYQTQNLVTVIPLKVFKNKSELDSGTLDIKKFPGYGSLTLENGIRETRKDDSGKKVNSVALHNLGWEKADDPEYSDVDLFFSCERCVLTNSTYKNFQKDVAGLSEFFKLSEKHPYAGFLFNATLNPEVLEGKTSIIDPTYQLNFGPAYWNICNELVIDLVDGSRFMSTMIGSRAIMQTRIIEYKYGGVAPEFTNTGSPSMGGQLPGLVSTKLRFKYTKDQQDKLDEMNFNPVVSDRTYGLMLTGQKTCKDGDITDWSYIGHVSAFLNFEKEVKAAVMDPQVGKPNNPYYRELRKFQAEEILSKRLTGATRIWAAGIVDTSTADGVNDVQALRARQFRIKIAVKVDTFSEYVILDFTNVDQGTDL